MTKKTLLLMFGIIIILIVVTPVRAQDEGLKFSISRDFGYGGGKDIQGLFSMKVTGPGDLIRVEFHIDDEIIYNDTQEPFKVQFSTDDYPLGEHELYAVGYLSDGSSLTTKMVHANFVTADEGWAAAGKIVIPILVVVFGSIIIAAVVPIITGKKTVALTYGEQRSYPFGGGICPKCDRPYAFHLLGFNLLTKKLDRCPYCGKWSAVRPQPLKVLREAEQAELSRAQSQSQIVGDSAEDKIEKELNDSKYQDL